MIIFSAVEKSYNDKIIIKANLELAHPFYWLKGPNGSGKSTLFRCIAGITAYKGSVAVNSLTIRTDRKAYRQAVSYAEAEPLYPEFLTGADLISFYAAVRKANQLQTDNIINALGISHFLQSKISSYSSGMLKKLSLALAFMGHPQVILLDEPFITIDEQGMTQLNGLITDRLSRGVQLIITSHQDMKFSGDTNPILLNINNAELVMDNL